VAHPQVAAFARLANGGQVPARRIYGQTSMLSRTMHDIRYNAVDDEIIVPNPFQPSSYSAAAPTGRNRRSHHPGPKTGSMDQTG
jgi:hypothetical protein